MASRILSWLDTLIFGVRQIWHDSAQLPERAAVEFAGDGVTIEDNTTTKRTVITIAPLAGAVPTTRVINTTDGLTGGGALSSDLTIGLSGINDAQHGSRAGGTLHAAATTSVAGFMSATDKTKLDGLPSPADAATVAYVDAEIAAIPAGTTYTAGAGLTEDPAATFKIDAADATITVNANSIEASGNFGAKGLYTDAGLDTATAVPLPIGNGNCTDIVLGQAGVPVTVEDDCTVAGVLTETRNNVLTTTTGGIGAVNAHPATNPAQVQKGPVVYSSGQAWDSDDSVTRTVRAGWYTEPRAGSTVGYYVRLALDAGAGTWGDSGLYYTNSDPALFGSALVGPTFVSASGNGFWLYAYGSVDGTTTSRGGLAYDGADTVRVTATGANQKVGLRTNSTNRLIIDASGNQTYTMPAASKVRREYGTAATRYIDYVSAVFTSDTSLGYETALSYTLPDNCAAVAIFWLTAIDTVTGDVAGYGKRRVVKRWAGGAAATVGSERDLGADDEDDVSWLVRTNVTGNTVYVEVDGDGSNPVKWGIDLEIHITLTTA